MVTPNMINPLAIVLTLTIILFAFLTLTNIVIVGLEKELEHQKKITKLVGQNAIDFFIEMKELEFKLRKYEQQDDQENKGGNPT